MGRKLATSCIYDTVYGGSKNMKGGSPMTTDEMMKLVINKKGFLVKVFATLITQLGITYYIMTNYDRDKDKSKIVPKTWVLIVASFAIILLLALVRMNIYFKFAPQTYPLRTRKRARLRVSSCLLLRFASGFVFVLVFAPVFFQASRSTRALNPWVATRGREALRCLSDSQHLR